MVDCGVRPGPMKPSPPARATQRARLGEVKTRMGAEMMNGGVSQG
jgi:hypothetical protein